MGCSHDSKVPLTYKDMQSMKEDTMPSKWIGASTKDKLV